MFRLVHLRRICIGTSGISSSYLWKRYKATGNHTAIAAGVMILAASAVCGAAYYNMQAAPKVPKSAVNRS